MLSPLRLGAVLCVTALLTLAFRPAEGGAAESTHRSEAQRLQRHFDQVDRELRARDVQHLTVAQRAHRGRLITWLREYRHGGVFPHNDRFPGVAMPFFRDARGVLCAMAYLIDRSGRGDIVERVARTANNAYIPELATDPALLAWLDSTGLSVEEAARIQPAYGGVGIGERGARGPYLAASVVGGAAGLITAGFNMAKPTATSGVLGLTTGAALLVIATQKDDSRPDEAGVAKLDVGLGVGTALLGGYGLYRSQRRSAERRASSTAFLQDVRVGPAMIPIAGDSRLGLAMQARF